MLHVLARLRQILRNHINLPKFLFADSEQSLFLCLLRRKFWLVFSLPQSYNNGRKEKCPSFKNERRWSILIRKNSCWPHNWPLTFSEYSEHMQIRAPKSIGFGAKRAEKSPYKRTIPYDSSLGARCRVFESPHSDHIKTKVMIQLVLQI